MCQMFHKAEVTKEQLAAAQVIIHEDRKAQLAARLRAFEEAHHRVAREGAAM